VRGEKRSIGAAKNHQTHASSFHFLPPSLPPFYLHEGLLSELLLDGVGVGLVEEEGGDGDVRPAAVVRHDLRD